MYCYYRDVLLFLKLHDGYPEPIQFNFRESEYGYFWKRMYTNPSTGIEDHFDLKQNVACSVAMLRQVYDNQILLLRRQWDDTISTAQMKRDMIKKKSAEYSRDGQHEVSDTFIMGRFETNYAAYHCTWYYILNDHRVILI